MGTVTCNNDHTVDISITNLDDIAEWTDPSEWRLENNANCDPTIDQGNSAVNYAGLVLPDCALEEQQLADSVKYVLKVSATKSTGAGPGGQLRAYDHLYYVSCDYDNEGNVSASFIPIVNRGDNDTGTYSVQQ